VKIVDRKGGERAISIVSNTHQMLPTPITNTSS